MRTNVWKHRLTAIFLSLIMVFTMLPISVQGSFAENNVAANEQDYEFDKDTGTITKYLGSKSVVEIPDKINGVNVNAIGDRAFSKKNLTEVKIPEGIKVIGKNAFSGNKITTLELSSTVTDLEDGAFMANGSLTSLTLNEGLININKNSFRKCENLETDIKIPSTVKYIGNSTFDRTPISSLTISEGNSSTPLTISSAITKKGLNINIEDPYRPINLVHNYNGCNANDSVISLGSVDINAEGKDEVEKWLKENIGVKDAAQYINTKDGEQVKPIISLRRWDIRIQEFM